MLVTTTMATTTGYYKSCFKYLGYSSRILRIEYKFRVGHQNLMVYRYSTG